MQSRSITTDVIKKWDRELLFEILDNIKDVVLIVDSKGIITYVNRAYTEIFGILPEKVLGKNLYRIESDALMLKVLKTGKPIYYQQDYIKSLKIDAIGISFPIYGDKGELIGAVSLFDNQSKLVELTQELERTKEMTAYLNEQLNNNHLPKSFKDYIYCSSVMREILNLADKAAKTNCTVLIRGESGVGKEVMAKAIHNASKRKEKPLVKVNCASIPENLLESELFGYEDGAFTGAKKGGKIGKFELANEGTIFLDEIGDMSFNMQAKLLRVIQEKELERVGGIKIISLNVRIIAATNRDLEQMIEENKFRRDLYYRLNVMPLVIPPLRERKEDIMPLARHFLKKLTGDDVVGITPKTIKILQSYDWPGNIRELQNVLEHANILRTSKNIELQDLPKCLRLVTGEEEEKNPEVRLNIKNTVALLEKELILEALKCCNKNKSMAIQKLGISRRSFYEKLNKYGLTGEFNEE